MEEPNRAMGINYTHGNNRSFEYSKPDIENLVEEFNFVQDERRYGQVVYFANTFLVVRLRAVRK